MAAIHWEPERVKSQLRAAAASLGARLEKKDAASREARGHVVHLLLQNDVDGARMQTRRVMHDDALADVYELLESYCGGLLDRLGELTTTRLTPDSPIYESVCAIIYAAPRTDCAELRALRDNLLQHYGASFAVAIADSPQSCVPEQIVRALDEHIPPRQEIDDYLARIALASGLDWHPPLSSRDKLMWLAALYAETSPQVVDINVLRRVAAQGLVDDPPWVRPLSWRLMLNTLPADRALWTEHNTRKRDEYYDLARRLLSRLKELPSPTSPLSVQDQSLLSISRALPGMLPNSLEHPVESPLNPFDPSAADDIRIDNADEVDRRSWMIINRHNRPQPEIQLNGDATDVPQISLTTPPVTEPGPSTPVLRLLYIYACLHPSTPPSHLPSILIPIYTTLAQTTDETDVCHVEADAFWMLEEVSAEFSDLWTDEGCDRWRAAIAHRLSWADPDLLAALDAHGLNPSLPHYSYRWLTPILSSTFPLPATRLLWDSIFTCPMIQTGVMPKIDYLVDICASMLIKQRTRILRLCPPPPPNSLATPDPEAMMQVIQLLQSYPLDTGMDNVLDFALHIAMRRISGMLHDPTQSAVAKGGATIGQTLRDTMWKIGRPNLSVLDSSTESEDDSPDEPVEEKATTVAQQSNAASLSSRLWKGLTTTTTQLTPVQETQGVEDDPGQTPNARTFNLGSSMWKSLTTPRAAPSTTSTSETSYEPRTSTDSSQTAVSTLWSYAEKLRDSDTAAALAKTTTNFRIKAVDALTSRGTLPKTAEGGQHARATSLGVWGRRDSYGSDYEHQRNSYPLARDYGDYVPPPRPKFFKPSVTPPGVASPPIMSPKSSSSGLPSPDATTASRASSIQAALAALTNSTPKKTGPRPLLLNSAALITPPVNAQRSRSPTPSGDRWAHVQRGSQNSQPRNSRSSISSMSTGLASPIVRTQSPSRDSDGGGRFVPLRRNGVSPFAPATSESETDRGRAPRSQRSSLQSVTTIPEVVALSDTSPSQRAKGWEMVSAPDSPPVMVAHERAVTMPTMIEAEEDAVPPLHARATTTAEPESIAPDASGSRQSSIRRAGAVTSRRRSEDSGVARAETLPEGTVILQKAPRVRMKRYVHKTTPSMQHVHALAEEGAGAAGTDTTDSERDKTPRRSSLTHSRKNSAVVVPGHARKESASASTHVRKESTSMSMSTHARKESTSATAHGRKDSVTSVRRESLTSPRSPRSPRGPPPPPPPKPSRRGTEADADDEGENYADILLAYDEQ